MTTLSSGLGAIRPSMSHHIVELQVRCASRACRRQSQTGHAATLLITPAVSRLHIINVERHAGSQRVPSAWIAQATLASLFAPATVTTLNAFLRASALTQSQSHRSLLVLMVVYTMASLWIVAQPIID
jgi:hypothetical protein